MNHGPHPHRQNDRRLNNDGRVAFEQGLALHKMLGFAAAATFLEKQNVSAEIIQVVLMCASINNYESNV